jgi:hypothetical protein
MKRAILLVVLAMVLAMVLATFAIGCAQQTIRPDRLEYRDDRPAQREDPYTGLDSGTRLWLGEY